MSIITRLLRQQNKAFTRDIKKRMRKDLLYLILPKPCYLPRFIWLFLLQKLVRFNSTSLNINKLKS